MNLLCSYTIPEDQGQMIETSYSWSSDGWIYMRQHDRSDQNTHWYRAQPDWDREGESIEYERAPYVIGEFKRCEEPD
jgi:hypothetical protein